VASHDIQVGDRVELSTRAYAGIGRRLPSLKHRVGVVTVVHTDGQIEFRPDGRTATFLAPAELVDVLAAVS
jgi:hypothetical protein